jgi:uncharacterized protein YjbI with pentapeptide repeats
MYKLISYESRIVCVNKTEGNIINSIPFDPANTDYANFKKEVLAGAELQDADGNVMTQEQADAFIATLP